MKNNEANTQDFCDLTSNLSLKTRRGRGLPRALGLVSGVAMLIAGSASGAYAKETLKEALAAAYASNPELDAQRAAVRVSDEGVNRARANYYPNANATASRTEGRNNFNDGPFTPFEQENINVSIDQNIFRGFRTRNEILQARAQVYAARAQLELVEQRVLQQAVTAYMDVLRDEATLALNTNNVSVLQRQLQASQDRFRVGEVTRTDVAQSEARLEGAKAQVLTAEANLAASRAAFERIVGRTPAGLSKPEATLELPLSRDEAIAIALEESPNVKIAMFNEQAAKYGIYVAKGALLPSVGARGSFNQNDGESFFGTVAQTQSNQRYSFSVQLTVPLYAGGGRYSDVRRAKQLKSQRLLEIRNAERVAQETVLVAYNNYRAAIGQIASNEAQVRANTIALEGVRQEAAVGSRTTLDVLNAEQELLNSRVSLVRAERDYSVASYGLLQAMGRLTAKDLALDVENYDPQKNYDDVKNKFFGF